MSPFLMVDIFLLCCILPSLAHPVNFVSVFEWNEMDYEWPSEASRAQALKDGTFEPKKFVPIDMAVYGERVFISLENFRGIPVTLVSFRSSSGSSAPPKLTPVSSWDMHAKGDCNKIQAATGLRIYAVGKLLVLDEGSDRCNAKLVTIDSLNNDHTEIIHRFPFRNPMHGLVLDGTFAYISRVNQQHIVVFSFEKNESWIVETPGIEVFSIALSPKNQEPRQLYLSKFNSNDLYSIPVAALRKGNRIANPKVIGKWAAKPYKMLEMDHKKGTMLTTFLWRNYISSWNISQPLEEQRFYEVAGLNNTVWPFTFAFDQNGTFWVTVFDDAKMPRFRLLKAAVGAKSNIHEDTPEMDDASAEEKNVAENGAQHQGRISFDSIVLFVFLLAGIYFV